MITGKSNREDFFAKTAVVNFDLQTYQNKHLIIINEGKTKTLLKYDNSNKIEIFVKKTTLGKLRNIALELVPPNAIWTTWDDDDWRCQDYLSILFHALNKNKSKRYLMYTKRIDHNLNNNFTYEVHIPSGTYIFFCYKDPMLKYDNLDTKEDAITKQYILGRLEKTLIYENDATLYIRFVHNNNTSVYVDKFKKCTANYKKKSSYFEYNATNLQKQYVNKIKKK